MQCARDNSSREMSALRTIHPVKCPCRTNNLATSYKDPRWIKTLLAFHRATESKAWNSARTTSHDGSPHRPLKLKPCEQTKGQLSATSLYDNGSELLRRARSTRLAGASLALSLSIYHCHQLITGNVLKRKPRWMITPAPKMVYILIFQKIRAISLYG